MENIKITLAAARANKGLTQEQAAKELHVAKSSLSAWERGARVPSNKNVEAIVEVYGISIDNLTFKGRRTPAALN